jgi:predicted GNAT family acetyltransferase
VQVRDNPDNDRYEITADAGDGEGPVIGFAAYQKAERLIVFTHTEIDPGWEGQGVGSTLVRAALDDVRRQGLPVLPICPFVQSWMQRHPDYADLDYRAPRSTATD